MSDEVNATGVAVLQSPAELYTQWCAKEGCRANSALLRHLAGYPTTRALEQLSLRNNYLGPRGLRPVLRLIEACQAIHTLDLEGNGVDNETVLSLCAVLVQHLSLRAINLARNPISLVGGRALLELLERAPGVVEVDVRETDITAALQERIAAAVAANRRRLCGSQPQLVPIESGATVKTEELLRSGAARSAVQVNAAAGAVRTRKAALELLHHVADVSPATALTWHAGQADRPAAPPTSSHRAHTSAKEGAVWLTTQHTAGTAQLTAPQPRPPLPALASQHTAAPPLRQIHELAVAFAARSHAGNAEAGDTDGVRQADAEPIAVPQEQAKESEDMGEKEEEEDSDEAQLPADDGAKERHAATPLPPQEEEEGEVVVAAKCCEDAVMAAGVAEGEQHAAVEPSKDSTASPLQNEPDAAAAVEEQTGQLAVVHEYGAAPPPSAVCEGGALDDLLQPARCAGMSTEERFEALFDAGCTAYGGHDLDTAYMAWNEAMRIAVARKNREWMAVLSSNLQRLSYELLVQEGNAHLARGELEAADDNFATALEVAVRARQAQWQSAMHTARKEVQNAVFHRCHEAALAIFNKAQQLTPQPVTEQDVFVVPGTDILVRHSAAFVFQWSCLLLVQEALRTWCEAARLAQRMGGTAAAVLQELVREAVNTVACFLIKRLFDATVPAAGLSGQHTAEYHYHECVLLSELWADMSAYSEQHLQHALFAAVAAAQLGNLYLATNQLALAERQFERVVASATAANVPALRATGLTFAGVLHWQRANYALAERHLQDAIAVWQELQQVQQKRPGQRSQRSTPPRPHSTPASAGSNRLVPPSSSAAPSSSPSAGPHAHNNNSNNNNEGDSEENGGGEEDEEGNEMKATAGGGQAGMREQLRRAIPVGYVDLMNYTAHMYLVDTLACTFRYRDALEALERGLTRLHRDLLLVKTQSNFTLSPTLEQIAAIAHELRSPLVYYFLHKRYEWSETESRYDVEESIFVWVVAPCKEMRFVELNVSKDYKTSITALLAQVRAGWHLDPLDEASADGGGGGGGGEMITTLPHAAWMGPLRVLYAVFVDPILDFVRALSPAAQSLGGTDDMCDTVLTLIPTGPLWLVPFNALIHGTTPAAANNSGNSSSGAGVTRSEEGPWRYLVEEAAVQLAFSATQCAFSALSARRVRQRRRYRDVVVVQAETDPTALAGAEVQSVFAFDVPRSRAEGAAVVSTWQAIRSSLVGAATRAASPHAVVLSNSEMMVEELDVLRSVLPQSRTVHVASAVVTVPTSVAVTTTAAASGGEEGAAEHEESGTAAAVPLPACEARGYEGAICATVAHHDLGLLRASEVERMELLAELVVLTNTNLHAERVRGAQDGLHCVLRAFFSAGVPCVMAGQWCTPDMVPSELFCAYYRSFYGYGEEDEARSVGSPRNDEARDEEVRGEAARGRPGAMTEGKVYVQLSSAGAAPGTQRGEAGQEMTARGAGAHKALALARAMRQLLEDAALRYNPRAWAGYYCVGSGLL